MKNSCVAMMLALLVFLAAPVSASTITRETELFSVSHPMSATDWVDTFLFPRFDSTLGTLTRVYVQLTGDVQGTAQYESLNATPRTVTLNLQSTLDLKRPDGSLIVQAIPLATISEDAAAYDGATDFGGASGSSFSGLQGQDTDYIWLTAASDLALFTGTEPIALGINANGTSTSSGGGNLAVLFSTDAAAIGGIKYEYQYEDYTIPEPGTFILLGAGLLAFASLFRKRLA